jgi:hypothetical protein
MLGAQRPPASPGSTNSDDSRSFFFEGGVGSCEGAKKGPPAPPAPRAGGLRGVGPWESTTSERSSKIREDLAVGLGLPADVGFSPAARAAAPRAFRPIGPAELTESKQGQDRVIEEPADRHRIHALNDRDPGFEQGLGIVGFKGLGAVLREEVAAGDLPDPVRAFEEDEDAADRRDVQGAPRPGEVLCTAASAWTTPSTACPATSPASQRFELHCWC